MHEKRTYVFIYVITRFKTSAGKYAIVPRERKRYLKARSIESTYMIKLDRLTIREVKNS
jgi:hypothetical protein